MKILPILIAISYCLGLLMAVVYLGYALIKFPTFLLKKKYNKKFHMYY